ncbi:MAG: efflux RND transporter periplasmic adaptor subunit [Planctomycetes bacterium]|nr:efflux RND transporter periplasmic adaptor subunit [Planctomycetota bacterium]
MKYIIPMFTLALLASLVVGCTGEDAPAEGSSKPSSGDAEPVTNRIDVPANVRQNLGIVFGQVQKRMVSKTIRLPGQFELPPESSRVYTTRLAGQVELLVKQYQAIKVGDPLYKLSPLDWPDAREALQAGAQAVAQAKLSESQALAKAKAFVDPAITANQQATRRSFESQISGINAHLVNLEAEKELAVARVDLLEDLISKGAGRAMDLAAAKAELAGTISSISEEQKNILDVNQSSQEFEASILARNLEAENLDREAGNAKDERVLEESTFDAHLRTVEIKFGLSPSTLTTNNWQTIEAGTVTAINSGTVTDIHATSGQWLEGQANILVIKDLTQLRFRAHALQGDLGLIKDGQPATIVPPVGSSLEGGEPATGITAIAPESESNSRISEVLINLTSSVSWARNGIRAEVEIVYDQTKKAEFAIPEAALVKDGLDLVYFKRGLEKDDELDKVIRMKAGTLGPSDGVWVVIYGGVGPKTEIVIKGAYVLKLASSALSQKGGHFHADGTFHEEGSEH